MSNKATKISKASPEKAQSQDFEAIFSRPLHTHDLVFPTAVAQSLERMRIFLRQRQPLLLVGGPGGTGKSTIVRWLYDQLSLDHHDVLLVALISRESKAGWLLPKLASYLGVPNDAKPGQLLASTLAAMDDFVREGRSLVVIVDAAEKLQSPEAFTEVQALLDLQNLGGRCLSFVMIGNESFLETLQAVPELSQHVSYRMTTGPLQTTDVSMYLASRLVQAGAADLSFTGPADQLISSLGQGIYTRINAIAENCCVEARLENVEKIDENIVKFAARSVVQAKSNEIKTATPNVDVTVAAPIKPKREHKNPLASTQNVPAAKKPEPTPSSPHSSPKDNDAGRLASLFEDDSGPSDV